MVAAQRRRPELRRGRPGLPRADRGGRFFGELRASDIRDVVLYVARIRVSRLAKRHLTLPLIGEFNVRNAAMAISGGALLRPQPGSDRRRRSRVSKASRAGRKCAAKVRGVTVIDDFGHHPTAIRETLRGAAASLSGHRLWAIFEPRSNTTRRAIFQHELPRSAPARRRRFHRAGRGTRADPGGATARSGSGRARHRGGRPARLLRARRRRDRRADHAACCSLTMSSPSSATAASMEFTRSCWRSWPRCSRTPASARRAACADRR